MSINITERLQTLALRLQNINRRVADLSNNTEEPNALTIYRTNLMTGPLAPVGIVSIHTGSPQANVKMSPSQNQSSVDIFIDDILTVDSQTLSYRFTSLDLKLKRTETIGLIYQVNGLVLSQNMIIDFDTVHKQYTLTLTSSTPIAEGQIFIAVSTVVNSTSYEDKETNLEPIDPDGPGNGGTSRSIIKS